MKTLQLLMDYAETNENVWLANKLDILQQEIQIAILRGEMKEIKRMQKKAKDIFNV